jgi:hypothetical protein
LNQYLNNIDGEGFMQEDFQMIVDMLPFLIPLFLIQIALMVIAIVDLFRRENMKTSTRVIWALVIIIVNIIGPVIYLFAGRKDKPIDSD